MKLYLILALLLRWVTEVLRASRRNAYRVAKADKAMNGIRRGI